MSTIDEMSRALGRIEALIVEQGRDLNDVKKAVEPVPVLIQRMDKIEPHVEDYKRSKNRVLGMVLGLGAGSGGAVGWLTKYLQGS